MTKPAHSKIGASSMYRWSKCPGSVKLSEGIEAPPSPYAEEGTQAHEAAAHYLEKLRFPDFVYAEMEDAIKVYIDTVFGDRPKGAKVMVEHRFDLEKVYPGLFGTADAVIYDAKQKLLRVYDYKHGAGVAVEVKNNLQLMYYALGALLSLGYPAEKVESVIVQPRCPHPDGPVRRWRYDAVDLLDFCADLVEFAIRTENHNAPLVSGDHCRFCPAAATCPELSRQALVTAKNEFKAGLAYEPEQLSEILHRLPILEAWSKSVREFAYSEAQQGRCPPGWKLVQKRASRKWKNPEEAAHILQRDFGLKRSQVFHDPEFKSVAQIEKFFSKEKKPELQALVVSESSGATLAPIDDPRPQLTGGAADDFEAIT